MNELMNESMIILLTQHRIRIDNSVFFMLRLILCSMMFGSSYVEKYFSNGKGYHRNPVSKLIFLRV